MRPLLTSAALAALLLSSSLAQAAATQEQADAIKASIEKYVGATPGVVTVTPSGDSYEFKFDPAPLIAKADLKGATASVTPVTFKLTDSGSGKWAFDTNQPWSLSVKNGTDMNFEYKIAAVKYSGVWDETIGGVESMVFSTESTNFVQDVFDPQMNAQNQSTGTAQANSGKMTGVANAAGGVDLAADYEIKAYAAETKITSKGGGPSFAFTYKFPLATSKSQAAGFKQKELLALLAWFVAHPSADAIKGAQGELKPLLSAALPMFLNMNGNIAAEKVDITTSMGNAKVGMFDLGLDMNGFVKEGKVGEKISIKQLELPAAIVPPWAAKIVPQDIVVDFMASGFNAEAPAKLFIEKMDLNQDPPIPESAGPEFIQAVMPNGTMNIALNPSSIASSLYTLSMDGNLVVSLAGMPTGKATVRMKGFDQTMAALQEAAASDPSVQQAIGPLLMAKGFSKTEGDQLVWLIESTPTGGVLVNGVDLSKMGGNP